jgi:hypothetical protein
VRLQTLDCDAGAHYGYAYFTLGCSDGKLKGLTCGENPVYKYEAPAGFLYRWYSASNPDVTLSEERVFEIATNDKAVYNVDIIQPTNLHCYYTLSAIAEERWPRASAKSTIVGGCENKISFVNKSSIILVDPETHDTTVTSQPCESFYWDFGDGTTSYDENPIHVFPNEGGTYTVKFTAGIVGGLCTDVEEFTFTFPKVGTTRDTVNAVVCFGNGYDFNGRTYFGDGCYSDTLVSIYGCDRYYGKLFSGEIKIKIGKPIKATKDLSQTATHWCESIASMGDFVVTQEALDKIEKMKKKEKDESVSAES